MRKQKSFYGRKSEVLLSVNNYIVDLKKVFTIISATIELKKYGYDYEDKFQAVLKINFK